jgi:hypothetical protein
VAAVAAVAAAEVAGVRFLTCKLFLVSSTSKNFNDIRSFLPSFDPDCNFGMALKETKKERERRLKKAEEQLRGAEAEATDAPTDGPTDDDKPGEPLLYDAEGGLRPGTSAAAAAAAATGASAAASAAPINAVASAKVGASLTLSTSDSSDVEGFMHEREKGSARARKGTTGTKAKRASTRLSKLRSKAPKKAKKSKKLRRRKESSSLSSSDDRRRGRSHSSSSSSSSSGDSDWEEFYDNATVIKVRQLLKTPPPTRSTQCFEGSFFFPGIRGGPLR